MADDIDPLGNEVSVEVRLDERGIKAATKSRAMAALDRLCGNLIDLPGGWIEGKARRQRIQNQLNEALMIAEGQAALDRATGDPDFGRRVLENFTADLARKQANRDGVASEAIEDLRENSAADSAPSGQIEDDWLNVFSSHAENASSEHLQKMWGKVLSGEIRRPGSFSLSTLRFISELDQQIATIFESSIRERIGGQFLLKADKLKGEPLLNLVFLEEVGLLQHVAGVGCLTLTYKYDDQGWFRFREGNLVLICKGPENSDVPVEVIKITRTGQEIAKILPMASPKEAITKMADKFKSTATSIELAIVTAESPTGQVSYSVFEKIK